jgi:cation-transporting ATPase E
MLFAEPPTHWFAGGASYRGDRLPTIAAIVLLIAYLVLLAIPGLRAFFQLLPLPPRFNLAIGGMTVLWMLVQRAAWRGLWFERFLDMAGAASGVEATAPDGITS